MSVKMVIPLDILLFLHNVKLFGIGNLKKCDIKKTKVKKVVLMKAKIKKEIKETPKVKTEVVQLRNNRKRK